MLNRLLVAILGIPLLMGILYKGGLFLLLLVNVIILFGLFEFYKMAESSEKNPETILGCIAGLAIPNIIYFSKSTSASLIIMPITILSMILMTKKVLKNQVEKSSESIGITVFGVCYISILFSHMLLISFLPNGGKWLITIQILVWICDSSAYFVGMNMGRKFFPKGFSAISPKKSVEGSIGGIIFTIITIFIIEKYFNLFDGNKNIIMILLYGFIIAIIAQIGDLCESMFKREFGIKDSGKILGEHGGMLDRFDSMIFVLPTVYYFLKFL